MEYNNLTKYPLFINRYVDMLEDIVSKYIRLPEDVVYSYSRRIPIPINKVDNIKKYSKVPIHSFLCLPLIERYIQWVVYNNSTLVNKDLFISNPLQDTVDGKQISFCSNSVIPYTKETLQEIITIEIEEITEQDIFKVINILENNIGNYVYNNYLINKTNRLYTLDYDYCVILLVDNGEIGSYRLAEYRNFKLMWDKDFTDKEIYY